MSRAYAHFTQMERNQIQHSLQIGKTHEQITRALNRDRSSIYREINRNSQYGMYRAKAAECKALKRRHMARRTPFFSRSENVEELKSALKKKWSPEQIHGRKREEGFEFASRSTTYRYLKGKPRLRSYLRGPTEKRKRDKQTQRIRNPRMIDERPEEVAERKRHGDWEADSVRSRVKVSAGVATFVEEKSGFLVAELLRDRKALTLNKAARKGLRGFEVKTLTVDNGMEFSCHSQLEEFLDTQVYFCHPRSPWERGQNEYTNRLLRHYFPKGTDFSEVCSTTLMRVVDEINDRPRKRLGYRTPREVHEEGRLHL